MVSDSIMKLDGKALVFGVASEDSIAYAICQRLAQAGCSLVLGFQPRFRSRIQQLSATLPEGTELHPIDVNVDGSTASFFESWQSNSPGAKADIIVHSIGFAPREAFDRNLLFVDMDPMNVALRISAHSLQGIVRHVAAFSSQLFHHYPHIRCKHQTCP